MWLVIDRRSKRPLGQADSLADALRGMKEARAAGYDADVRKGVFNPRIKFSERRPRGKGHRRKITLREQIERDLGGPIVMRRGHMLLPTHPDYKRLAKKARNPSYSQGARTFISQKISKLAHEGMEAPQRVAAAHQMARRRGFKVPNPRNCYAVIDYGAIIKSLGFRFTVQCLPDRPLQVPPGVQILVRGMTQQGARALADHLNGEVKRGRHVPRQPIVRLNPAFLRRGARGAFFQVRRSNPTLAVMGANPPRAAGDEIEATWAFLSYRRPDDPDGKRIVREHEFTDGFMVTPLDDGSILLKHPRGSNLWTRR